MGRSWRGLVKTCRAAPSRSPRTCRKTRASRCFASAGASDLVQDMLSATTPSPPVSSMRSTRRCHDRCRQTPKGTEVTVRKTLRAFSVASANRKCSTVPVFCLTKDSAAEIAGVYQAATGCLSSMPFA